MFTLEKHEPLLIELWSLLNCALVPETSPDFEDPKTTYEAVSEVWTLFGFQQKDPVSDIRGGGVLCIQHLIYFLREHRKSAEELMMKQKAKLRSRASIEADGVSKCYPFCAAGINVTRVMAQAFGLVGAAGNKTNFSSQLKTYWMLADEFNELYCVV